MKNQNYKEAQNKLESKLTDVIELEVKLATISPHRLRNYSTDTLVPYSIQRLSQKFSFLDWKYFFDSMLQATTSQGKYMSQYAQFYRATIFLSDEYKSLYTLPTAHLVNAGSQPNANADAVGTFSSDTEVLVQEDFLRGVNDLVMDYRNISGNTSIENGEEILMNYMAWRLLHVIFKVRFATFSVIILSSVKLTIIKTCLFLK